MLPGIDVIEAAQSASLARAALEQATARYVRAELRADEARQAAGLPTPPGRGRPEVARFYLSFYRLHDGEHPRFSLADPDGWVLIEAVDYDDARALAVQLLGTAWCDVYSETSWAEAKTAWPASAREICRLTTLSAAVLKADAR
jgi:hypothetical protein